MILKAVKSPLLACLLLFSFNSKADSIETHKFYVSLSDIKYNEESNTFQLSFSIFTDDLELAFEKQTGKKIHLDEITSANKQWVFEYVTTHFSAKADAKTLKLISIGYELESDVTWVYLESVKTEIPNSIELSNTILFELYSEQKNLVKISIGKDDYSALLTSENSKEIIKMIDE